MLCYLLLRRLPVLFLVNLQVTVYARDLLPDKSPRFAVNVHKRLELFGSNLEALRLSSSDSAYTPDGSVNLSISLKMKKKEVSLMTHATPLKFFSHLCGTIWLISCLFETSRVECAQHRVGRSVNPSGHVVQPVLSVNNKTKRTPQGAQSLLPPSFQTRNMYPH